jgi:hypothetical protein
VNNVNKINILIDNDKEYKYIISINMSVFRPRLARYNTICCQQIMPVPVIQNKFLSTGPPGPIYPLPLPFTPEPEPYCPPSIIPIEIQTYPTATTPPPGTILVNTTGSTPTGYLECNGAEISRTTYLVLFNVIGIYYGDGDTTTTFNVPNLINDCNINVKYIIKI